MLNRYSSGSNTVKHKSTWNKLLKSMLLDVILYTVLTIFSIILFFTYINPIIRENISGIKGALLSLSIILAVILPFLWAIIMKKNHSPEFQKLWNDSKYNRGAIGFSDSNKDTPLRKYPNAGYSSYIKRGIRCRIYCYPVDIGNDYLIQKN